MVTWKGGQAYVRRHQNSCDISPLASAFPFGTTSPYLGIPPRDHHLSLQSSSPVGVRSADPDTTWKTCAALWWHKRVLWALNGWTVSSSNASIRRPPHIILAQYPGCNVGVCNLRFRGVSCFHPAQWGDEGALTLGVTDARHN